jgi:hypothetical protein
MAAAGRAAGTPAGSDAGHRGPQHAHAEHRSADRRSGVADQVDTLRNNAREFGIRIHSLVILIKASCTSSARSSD